MIPKIIHQIWFSWKTNEIPAKHLEYQKKLIDLHPDWEYKLWRDEENYEFVKQNYPDFYPTFMALPKNIMRADIIRYLIMAKVGGLYLDLDYEMLKPFDLLDYELDLPYNRQVRFGDRADAFGNCIFASRPGHPFWTYVIKDLVNMKDYEEVYKSLVNEPYFSKEVTLEEAVSGPVLLTKVFFSVKDKLNNYYLPDREQFHPPVNRNNSARPFANTYGIHHCSGTWRDKSIVKKIKSRVQEFLGK